MKAAVYDALDFSLARDQQRTLSQQLEEVMMSSLRIETIWLDVKVIEVMTSGDEDEEDEGLGAEERTGLIEAVIDVCRLEWLSWQP